MIDRDGCFRWVNDAYIDMFGDRRGQPFVDGVAPEHRALARTNFARKVVGKTTRIFDLRVLDHEGNSVTLRITSSPLRRDGKVVGVFGIGVPIERSSPQASELFDELTPRQSEVLRLLSEGLETQEHRRAARDRRRDGAQSHPRAPAHDRGALSTGGRRDGDADGRARIRI